MSTFDPEKMTVISNIQTMQSIVGEQQFTFKQLQRKKLETLRQIQEELIPLYNEKKKKTREATAAFLFRHTAPFLKMLEKFCITYKLVGMGTFESPMWFQYMGLKNKEGKLFFSSSQTSRLWFTVDEIPDENGKLWEPDYTTAYNYFRKMKYTYIKANHPTIYQELK